MNVNVAAGYTEFNKTRYDCASKIVLAIPKTCSSSVNTILL